MSNARKWLRRREFLLLAGAAITGPRAARADAWPSRPVHLVCPLAAGGGIDATARIVGARLGDLWGQRIVVDNKPGASGNIAAEFVAHADPDGYTILITSFFHTTNTYLVPPQGFDPVADFAPVTLIATYPLVMVVPISSPAHSVKEFIAYAKTKKVSFASSGHGSSLHLAAELFTRNAGIDMTHVPYRGAGPAFTDLIAGRVDAMINFTSSSLPLVRQGQLRALAVTTGNRLSVEPDLPTMAEAGVAGVEVSSWSGFLVQAKTSREIVARLHDDTVKAVGDATVRDKLEATGAVVIGSTPAEFAAFLQAEHDKWGRIIKAAHIQAH